MNIDMTIDYDKLLEEAKKRYEKVRKLADEDKNLFIYGNSQKKYSSVHKKYLAAVDEFLYWEKQNLRDKLGVKLIVDFRTSAPIGIIKNNVVIAGHDNVFLDI